MGAEVTGYSLNPPTDPSLFEMANVARGMKSVIGDVRDFDALSKAVAAAQPEIVIHMAAQPLVRDSYKIPVETYAINVMGTVHLLESVRHCASVKAVVNVTTDKCYDNKEWVWGYRENEPMGGYDPYSNSKGCSELVTASYRNSFFNPKDYGKTHSVALGSGRAGNVIGGGDWATDRLIPDIIRSFLKKEPVLIRSPYAIRPWQHVLEPLSGYLVLGRKLYEEGAAFAEGWNFGPDDSDAKPVEWILNRICSQWGDGASFTIDKNPQPHEATYLKLDCSKAKSRLEWHPKWNLETALDKIIEWTKVYENGGDIREMTLKQIESYSISNSK
jgi:CDP-glucose 4,6-dehydratase